MKARYKLNQIDQLKSKSFFVDANVLIYLFWPTGNSYWVNSYATVFRKLLKQGNALFIDFLMISEVVNRIIRIEHHNINSNQNFKDFRNSDEGREVLHDIYTIVQDSILNNFCVVGKEIDKQDLESFLIVDDLDFVDKAIVSICKENNFVLLTNDKDFKYTSIDILSCNPSIL